MPENPTYDLWPIRAFDEPLHHPICAVAFCSADATYAKRLIATGEIVLVVCDSHQEYDPNN